MASNKSVEILPEALKNSIKQASVVVVKTDWNKTIIDELERGVTAVCEASNTKILKTITVPGAVEIPFAVNHYHQHLSFGRPDAYIVLGCVVKGDTPHFEYVCQSVTQGITMLNVHINKPVVFGVLTVNTAQQAWDRLGGSHGHKGKEAAETALSMIAMMRDLNDTGNLEPQNEEELLVNN